MDQAETNGPAAAIAVLQPLPAFAASAAANFAVLQLVPLPILQPPPAIASAAPVVTRDIGE